ncbi:hypothetical protein ACFFJB_14930 [Camelimonas abortus]|uniref:Uncharacterized protein n=1 Tax=Camelimonas abortus TaxID=1017184 RepID=A0ABV7LHK2_9HYPH
MKFPTEFWSVFAAVMMANMLTVALVYGLYLHSKREKGEDDTPWHVVYGSILLPLVLLIAGLHAVLTAR